MLYHYSEEPAIRRFLPRARRPDNADSPPIVWAIDEAHAVNYWLPRECPRIVYRISAAIRPDDQARFFSLSSADTVLAIESGWLDGIRSTVLYEYAFDETGFELTDGPAGYHISYEAVEPVAVVQLDDLIGRLLSRKGVELRFVPELHTLRNAILGSSVEDFSMIRLRNATGVDPEDMR